MLKGYEKYKSVNAFGMDKVPLQWNVKRTFSCLIENKKKNVEKEVTLLLQFKYGTIVPKKIQDAEKDDNKYEKYSIVHKGDIAINGLNLNYDFISQRVASVNTNGIITSAYLTFTPRKIDEQRYLVYLFKGLDGIKLFHGLGTGLRQTLTSDEVLKLQIPVPPKPEQDKIVQFLDWKISEMNHFIHQKKKQIKLLEELKRNIIDDLITNGKNSEKRVKISKAKWMGNVPYDWNEYRLKNLFQEINVRSELGLEPHLSMSQKKGLVTDDEDIERRLLSESYAGAKLCEKDDLVLNRLKAHLGVFALAPMKGIVSPDYTVLRINAKRVIPKYLEYLLKSNACRRELVTRVRGIVEGFWRLYTEDLGEIPVCIPNTEEQKAILEVILEKTNNIDEMISRINKEITLVEELRTKLISDVVTGQVDVRNVKIPAYETETDIIDSEEDLDEENQEESTE